MARFKEGDSVSFRGAKNYNVEGQKSVHSSQPSQVGKCVKTTNNGVKVEKSDGKREWVHQNRINN